MNSSERFFHLQEMFNLTAKDWLELLDSLDELSAKERDAVLHGRENAPYRGYE